MTNKKWLCNWDTRDRPYKLTFWLYWQYKETGRGGGYILELIYKNAERTNWKQVEKKASFTACWLGKLQLACTSPRFIFIGHKNVFDEQDWLQFFCKLNSLKVHLPVGQVACEQALLGRPGVRGWGREEGKEICLPRRQSAPRALARGLSGKLRTGSTTRIAKFTSPGLSDATIFARCLLDCTVQSLKRNFVQG